MVSRWIIRANIPTHVYILTWWNWTICRPLAWRGWPWIPHHWRMDFFRIQFKNDNDGIERELTMIASLTCVYETIGITCHQHSIKLLLRFAPLVIWWLEIKWIGSFNTAFELEPFNLQNEMIRRHSVRFAQDHDSFGVEFRQNNSKVVVLNNLAPAHPSKCNTTLPIITFAPNSQKSFFFSYNFWLSIHSLFFRSNSLNHYHKLKLQFIFLAQKIPSCWLCSPLYRLKRRLGFLLASPRFLL